MTYYLVLCKEESNSITTVNQLEQVQKSINNELHQTNTDRFIEHVDAVYYQALMIYFQTWYNPFSSLVSDFVIEKLLLEFEALFLLSDMMFATTSNTIRKYSKTDKNTVLKKRYREFRMFFSIDRLRNNKKLT